MEVLWLQHRWWLHHAVKYSSCKLYPTSNNYRANQLRLNHELIHEASLYIRARVFESCVLCKYVLTWIKLIFWSNHLSLHLHTADSVRSWPRRWGMIWIDEKRLCSSPDQGLFYWCQSDSSRVFSVEKPCWSVAAVCLHLKWNICPS